MGQLNATLNLRICPVCQRHGIKPPHTDSQSITYDYVCPNCNPNVTISITEIAFATKEIEKLKDNAGARSNLSEDIRAFEGDVYKIDTNVVQYFLGNTKHKNVTYHEWLEGNVIGDVRNWPMTTGDRDKVIVEQKKIFDKLVEEKFEYLRSQFEKRTSNSFDAKRLLVKEIEDVKDILVKDRYKFEYKPANEGFKIGVYFFRGFSIFQCIQEMYEAAIDGSIHLGTVPSEKQKVAVAGMNAKVDCMVQAYAFGKFLMYLENLAMAKVEEPSKDRISPAGVETLEHRFEKMKDEFQEVIAKGLENIDETQHKLFYELQSGQQVIFDEFDELKDFLKSLNKKTWIQVLKSKLMLMLERQILSKQTVDFIIERLNIDELDLGTKLLH